MLVACAGLCASAEVHELRLSTEVAVPVTSGSEKVWNLSTILAEDCQGPEYSIYSEGLVSEDFDGIRCWYGTAETGLARVEGVLWRLDPVETALVGHWDATVIEESATMALALARESMPDDTISGSLIRSADVHGMLILSQDTIPAILRSETLTVCDSCVTYVRESHRWFPARGGSGAALPVAASIRQSCNGKLMAQAAFTVDDALKVLPEDEMIDLEALDITVSDSYLTISSRDPLPEHIQVNVTDLPGRSYLTAVIESGTTGITLSISDLPTGRYIAMLSCRELTRKFDVRR